MLDVSRRRKVPVENGGWHFRTLQADPALKIALVWPENHACVRDTTENKCVYSPPSRKSQASKPSKVGWKFLPAPTGSFPIFYLLDSSTNFMWVTGTPTSYNINSELRVVQHVFIQIGMLLQNEGMTTYLQEFLLHLSQTIEK